MNLKFKIYFITTIPFVNATAGEHSVTKYNPLGKVLMSIDSFCSCDELTLFTFEL